MIAYFLCAVVMEMTAVFVVEGTPFLSRPFLSLGLLLVICAIVLLVPSNRARIFICWIMLFVQAILDLVFSVIFDMTDQYFDWGMLNLRNDAFGILENLPVDFITFYVGLALSLAFLILGLRYAYRERRVRATRHSIVFSVALMLVGVSTLGGSFVGYYPRTAKDKYDEMIDGRTSSAYSAYGMIGNLIGEVGNAMFKDRTPIAEQDIDEFIYQEVAPKSDYFGLLEGQNVVMILSESLEWYAFLRGDGVNEGEYPNALDIPQNELAELYPYLTKYYNESVVMTNFHGREKTDTAETISILGSYPTEAYVNYDYSENVLPQTLPNILKERGYTSRKSFHNGFKSFYNREEAHPMYGMEWGSPIDMDDMEEMSKASGEGTFRDWMDEGERNLDSEMVTTAKDLMFPTDQKFFTYITTITMHGMYSERENLQPENNQKLADNIRKLQKYKPTADTPYYKYAESLYYYMMTALEYDYMLGCIEAALDERGLLDNTAIVLFGDHNAYYQELSSYTKGISNDYRTEETRKFTDLYNIPLMIKSKKLTQALAAQGKSRTVDKFTCTADIVPTMLDLLGVRYYENLYYGHSVFEERESVLYSRAYDIFISDGIVRRSVKGEQYLYDGKTESGVPVKDRLEYFEVEGVSLVHKIKYCDYIFRQDHFGTEESYRTFLSKMQEINP